MAGFFDNIKNSIKELSMEMAEDYLPLPTKMVEITSAAINSQVRNASSKMGIMNSTHNMMSKLPYYKDLNTLVNNSFKAFKSGKIYRGNNFGGFDDDASDVSSYNMFDNGNTDSQFQGGASSFKPRPSVTAGESMIVRSTLDASEASSRVMVKTATKIHMVEKFAMTKLTDVLQNTQTSINTKLDTMVKFNNEIMKGFIDITNTYYKDSLKLLIEIRDGVKPPEKKPIQQAQEEESWVSKFNNGDWIGGLKHLFTKGLTGAGGVDNSAIMSMVGTALDTALPRFAEDPTQLVKMGLDELFDSMGLKSFKDFQESLMEGWGDKLNSAMTKLALSNDGFFGNMANTLRLRGVERKNVSSSDLIKDKAQVAWDNHSKMAVEVVIPSHLARIESLLGGKVSMYDYRNNRWRTMKGMDDRVNDMTVKDKTMIGNVASSMKGYLSSNPRVRAMSSQQSEAMEGALKLLTSRMMDSSLTMDDLVAMQYDGNNNYSVSKLLDFANNPHLKSIMSEDVFNMLKLSLEDAKRDKNKAGNIKSISDSMGEHNKRKNAALQDIKNGMWDNGALSLFNGFTDTLNENIGKGKTSDRNRYRDYMGTSVNGGDLDYTAERNRLLHLNNAMGGAPVMETDLTDEERASINNGMKKTNFLDILHNLVGNFMQTNDFTNNLNLGQSGFLFQLRNGSSLNMENLISNSNSNPLRNLIERNNLGGNISDTILNELGNAVPPEQRQRIQDMVNNLLTEVNQNNNDIDNDTNLSDEEKRKRKLDALMTKLKDSLGGITGIFGNFAESMGLGGTNSNGDKKTFKDIARISLVGLGGAFAGAGLGTIFTNLPGMAGAAAGSLGLLAPVFLGAMGVAGGLMLAKKGVFKTLFGMTYDEFKDDPEKKKQAYSKILTRYLPSGILGLGAGAAAGSIINAVLPFGGMVAGPLIGASVGIATSIMAYKKDFFKDLFGDSEEAQDPKARLKKMGSIIGSMALGAGVTAGAGLGLNALSGAPLIGSVLGFGGGLLTSPLILASAAVGATILTQSSKVKAWLFGEDNKNKGFFTNMKEFFFGDGDKKEGFFTKHWNRLTNWIDVGTNKMSKWFDDNIMSNIKAGFEPFSDAMSKVGKGVVSWFVGGIDKMSENMSKAFDEGFVKGIFTSFEEKIINPISEKMSSIFNSIFGFFGKLLASPFKWFADKFRKDKSDETPTNNNTNPDNNTEPDTTSELGLSGAGNKKSSNMMGKIKKLFNYDSWHKKSNTFGGSPFRKDNKYFYSQSDVSFRNIQIGDSKMSESGCAVATMAGVLSNLLNSEIKPSDLVDVAQRHKVIGDGITPKFFSAIGNIYGVNVEFYKAHEISSGTLYDYLDKPNRHVIVLMEDTYNNANRHYVHAHDSDKDSIIFNDPSTVTGKDKKMNRWKFMSYGILFIVCYKTKTDRRGRQIVEHSQFKDMSSVSPNADVFNFDSAHEYINQPHQSRRDLLNQHGATNEERGSSGSSNDELDQVNNNPKFAKATFSGLINYARNTMLKTKEVSRTLSSFKKENHNDLRKMHRMLLTQTNGVAYNMEYIKRILMVHMGDITDKPGGTGKFGGVLKKRNPIFRFFADIFGWTGDKVRGGIHGVVDIGRYIIDTVTDSIINNPLIRSVKDWLGNIVGTITNMIKIIPNYIEKIGKLLLDSAGKILRPIWDGILEVWGGAKQVLSDLYGASTTMVKDAYEIVSGFVKKTTVFLTNATMSIGTGIVNALTNTKLWKFMGDAMSGAMKMMRLDKLFGSTFNWLANKINFNFRGWGLQKVWVEGGTLNLVERIGNVGVIGAVDMDLYRSSVNASNTDAALSQDEAQIDNSHASQSNNGNKPGSGAVNVNDPRSGNVSNSSEAKEIDAQQDRAQDGNTTASGDSSTVNNNSSSSNTNGNNNSNTNQNNNNNRNDDKKSKFLDIANSPILKALGIPVAGGAFVGMLALAKKAAGFTKGLAKFSAVLGAIPAVGLVLGDVLKGIGNSSVFKFIAPKFAENLVNGAGDSVYDVSKKGMNLEQGAFNDITGANMTSEDFEKGIDRGKNRMMFNWFVKKPITSFAEDKLAKKAAEKLNTKGAQNAVTRYAKFKANMDSNISKKINKVMSTQMSGLTAGTKEYEAAYRRVSKNVSTELLTNAGMREESLLATFNEKSIIQNLRAKLFGDAKINRKLAEAGVNVTDDFLKGVSKYAAKKGLEKGGVVAARNIASMIPFVNAIALATMFVIDFSMGVHEAYTIMRVSKDRVQLSQGEKMAAGFVKALQGLASSFLPLIWIAFIPTEILMDLCLKCCFKETEARLHDERAMTRKIEFYESQIKDSDSLIKVLQTADKPAGVNYARAIKNNFSKDEKIKLYNATTFSNDTDGYLGGRFFDKDGFFGGNKELKFYQETTATAIEARLNALGITLTSDEVNKLKNTANSYGANSAGAMNNFLGGMHKVFDSNTTSAGTSGVNQTMGFFSSKKLDKSDAFNAKLMKDDVSYQSEVNKAKIAYRFGNDKFRYDEVSCAPTAIQAIYHKYGLKMDIMSTGLFFSYYNKKLNNQIPFKALIDFMIFDGLKVRWITRDNPEMDITNAVNMGASVILRMKEITGGGHFISVVEKIQDKNGKYKFLVHDPINPNQEMTLTKEILEKCDSGIVVAPYVMQGGPWYQVYASAKSITSWADPKIDFNKLGKFADFNMFIAAKIYSLNKTNTDNPMTNFDTEYLMNTAKALVKQYNLKISADDMYGLLIQDGFHEMIDASAPLNSNTTTQWQLVQGNFRNDKGLVQLNKFGWFKGNTFFDIETGKSGKINNMGDMFTLKPIGLQGANSTFRYGNKVPSRGAHSMFINNISKMNNYNPSSTGVTRTAMDSVGNFFGNIGRAWTGKTENEDASISGGTPNRKYTFDINSGGGAANYVGYVGDKRFTNKNSFETKMKSLSEKLSNVETNAAISQIPPTYINNQSSFDTSAIESVIATTNSKLDMVVMLLAQLLKVLPSTIVSALHNINNNSSNREMVNTDMMGEINKLLAGR